MLYQSVYWENPSNLSLSYGGTRNELKKPKWYAGPERLGTTALIDQLYSIAVIPVKNARRPPEFGRANILQAELD